MDLIFISNQFYHFTIYNFIYYKIFLLLIKFLQSLMAQSFILHEKFKLFTGVLV